MVKVGLLDKILEPVDGRAVTVAVSCVEGSEDGVGEVKRPGPDGDVITVEWVGSEAAEGGVEIRGRYTQYCRSPNGVSSGRARQDQPSLHMTDEIRSGHAAMYDRAFGLRLPTCGCSQDQTAKASRVAGGSWCQERPRQSQRTKGSNSRARQRRDGWLEKICRRQPSPRHRLEGGKSLESVAGQVLGGHSGMQDGSFPKPREDPALVRTFLPWSRRQLSEAGMAQ
jgi:hypothetical protein